MPSRAVAGPANCLRWFLLGTHLELGERISVHVDPWDDAKWALGAAALVLRAPFTHTDETGSDAVRARFAGIAP